MRIQISLGFRKGTYGEISEFCHSVVTKTDDVARYADLQTQLDTVKLLLTEYDNAVVAAIDGGKLLTQAKLNSKSVLLDAVENMALLTKVFANGNPSYVTDAGFNLRKKAVRSNHPLSQPEWNSLKRGVKSGTVEGEIKSFPAGVKEMGIKYSYDNWVTEKNGTYSTGKKFLLAGLDVKKEVQVKVCYLGTFQRKSDDSLPMQIFVL